MQNIFLLLLLTFASAIWAKERPTILVYNVNTKETVLSENADAVRPMASITKLMTAMVALDHYLLTDKLPLSKTASVTVEQLLIRLLVRSDNSASEVLARNYPQGRSAFIAQMNSRTTQLGLVSTEFTDPSGLLATNITTARELVKIVSAAGSYSFIRKISSQAEVHQTSVSKKRTKTIILDNTNKSILFEFNNILISKTGFTNKAGRCLAMLVDRNGQQHVIVILGEPTKLARDQLARNLLSANPIN